MSLVVYASINTRINKCFKTTATKAYNSQSRLNTLECPLDTLNKYMYTHILFVCAKVHQPEQIHVAGKCECQPTIVENLSVRPNFDVPILLFILEYILELNEYKK